MDSLYPLCPPNAVFAGRLLQISADGSLLIARDGKSFRGPPCAEARVGDLVACLDGGGVVILAKAHSGYWQREVAKELLSRWSEFRARVREFFLQRSFLEVDTPSLVVSPGTEPSLDVFATELVRGSRRQKLYLPTSPELHLKKALVLGLDRIFEIRRCFRNNEVTDRHQPEFWMLEWYRSYQNLQDIQQDVVDLIQIFRRDISVRTVSMAALFQEHLEIALQPTATKGDYLEWVIRHAAGQLDPRQVAHWQIDDLFFWLFTEKIEPFFDFETVVVVTDWPPFQAALARLNPNGWADRFEVYWRGFELANAFHELNDPNEQRLRFAQDQERKKHRMMGQELPPIDEEFLIALEAGLPPSAGIALGLERLFMALEGVKQIADLRLFPVKS